MALIGEWLFNEGSGNALDTSGAGRTLTPTGATWSPNGHSGAGAQFALDGTTLFTGTMPGSGSTNFSIAFWFKKLGNLLGSNFGTIAYVNSFPGIEVSVQADNNNIFLVQSNVAIGDLNWHHYACTQDGTNIKKYKDGVEVDTDPRSASFGWGPSAALYVGAAPAVDPAIYKGPNGIVDDLRIFDHALTPAEVTTYMNNPPGGFSYTSVPSNADRERTFLLGLSSDPNEDRLSTPDLRDVIYVDRQWPNLADPSTSRSAADVEIQTRRAASVNPLKDQMSLADLRREAWGG